MWLSVVLHYLNNFEKIKNIVLNLDFDVAMLLR